ncbi:MAG: hypothetical protein ACRYFW_06940 [Janthinobacterium lividum]
MADDNETEHQGFFGLRLTDDNESWKEFTFGSTLPEIIRWGINDKPAPAEDKAEDGLSGILPAEDERSRELIIMSELLARVLDAGLALSELTLSSRAIRDVFSQIVSRVEVVEPIRNSCSIVYQQDNIVIYGISADRMTRVRDQHRRLVRMDRGFDLLPSAVLLTVVATFDSLTADVVRTMLSLKPDRFTVGDRTIPVAEILAMGSFDELKSRLLDDEVYQFSRGSHEEQVKSIEKWFHVKIADSWKRWPDFIEVFERRNLIAHGEKQFTARYVAICKSHNHKGSENLLDTPIELTSSYISQALDVLVEFSILLVFSIWRKQLPAEENSAFNEVNDACYRMITEARYRVPVRVLEYVLSLKNTKIAESTRLMLIVNLSSAHRHCKNKDSSDKVLNSVDWSAVSDNYQICVASLRDDVPGVISLMPSVVQAKKIRKEDFRTWPVFSFVRSNEQFETKFGELFGEALFDPQAEATTIEPDHAPQLDTTNPDATFH